MWTRHCAPAAPAFTRPSWSSQFHSCAPGHRMSHGPIVLLPNLLAGCAGFLGQGFIGGSRCTTDRVWVVAEWDPQKNADIHKRQYGGKQSDLSIAPAHNIHSFDPSRRHYRPGCARGGAVLRGGCKGVAGVPGDCEAVSCGDGPVGGLLGADRIGRRGGSQGRVCRHAPAPDDLPGLHANPRHTHTFQAHA